MVDLLGRWNVTLSDAEARRLFRRYDRSGTNKLTTEDFLNGVLPKIELLRRNAGASFLLPFPLSRLLVTPVLGLCQAKVQQLTAVPTSS